MGQDHRDLVRCKLKGRREIKKEERRKEICTAEQGNRLEGREAQRRKEGFRGFKSHK